MGSVREMKMCFTVKTRIGRTCSRRRIKVRGVLSISMFDDAVQVSASP